MIRAALVAAFLATPAQADPAEDARAASARLIAAADELARAETRRDRVSALTAVVEAYEGGLAALRTAILDARIRETEIRTDLAARDDRLARVLGVLTSIGSAPETFLLLHPSGPLETARAGMVAADVAPAVQAQIAELRITLEELSELVAIREGAAETVGRGLAGIEAARAALTQAISDRTTLPDRVTTDAAAMLALIEASETLDAFAANIASTGSPTPRTGFEDLRGALPLPVRGRVLRGAGEADAAGVVRPGWLVATARRALVTAPAASTVRYAGPLLDYGNVIILEPESDYLLVLTGLGELLVGEGEIVAAGSALGLMPGATPGGDDIVGEFREGSGQEASETLYIEVREADIPVDPAGWFRRGQEE